MKYLTLITLLGLVGCKTLGLATPSSFDEQLANAYGVHTAVVTATANAITTGLISSTEGTQVQTQALSARAMLDTAKSIETSNPTGASNDMTLAVTALTALKSYLNSQAKPVAPATVK